LKNDSLIKKSGQEKEGGGGVMPLQKSKGNMYPWVTHTHCHLGGECPHKCVYCYVKSFPFRPPKYQGELRLIEKELDVNYGEGKTIFIENCNDMMAIDVDLEWIIKILKHCLKFPENKYVFQSKNPARFLTMDEFFPDDSLFGTTIETNRFYPQLSYAPSRGDRKIAMEKLNKRKFVTIEPIVDFDVQIFAEGLDCIRPEFVNIGADSKGHNLPEPPIEKVYALIEKLKGYGIEVREKHNLERLKP
jgi:hypothetical protein